MTIDVSTPVYDGPFDLLIDAYISLRVGTGKNGMLFRLSGEPARAQVVTIQENSQGFCGVDGTIDNNHSGFTGSG